MNFKQFADIINQKFVAMSNQPLFITNVPKEQLWTTYQSSYSAESNPSFCISTILLLASFPLELCLDTKSEKMRMN